MKILVFSDSHGYPDYMLRHIENVDPDVLIHLGDYYGDTAVLSDHFPDLPLYSVPGNCDQYRVGGTYPAVFVTEIDGVTFFLTHGHKHGVKFDLTRLKLDARRAGADAVLFGHTHQRLQEQEEGLWIVNPGACDIYNGSAALLITENNKICRCAFLSR